LGVARYAFASELIQARMPPKKIDSLAEDVKPLVLELLRSRRPTTGASGRCGPQ
jgi:hypothetical protein